MNILKKTLAFLFTAVLLVSMGTVAFASDDAPASGSIVLNEAITQDGETVSIKKEVVFTNAEATDVHEPQFIYTYTLTAATGVSATVKDSTGLTATVKDGVSAAIATASDTIIFNQGVMAHTSAAGTPCVKYADLAFDEDIFTAPGIYRYKVTETTSAAKGSVGITTSGTYDNVRYLDVYVQKKNASLSNAAGNMKIYGYVLYEGANEDVSFNGYTGETQNLTAKSDGFTHNSAGYDVYETQNIHVAKTTNGVLGDKTQDFGFTLTLLTYGGTITTAARVEYYATGGAVLNGPGGTTTTSSSMQYTFGAACFGFSGTIRDGATVNIVGIPTGGTGSTWRLVETNSSPDSYAVAMTNNGSSLLASTIVAPSGTATSSNFTVNTTANVAVTNTLDAISPTGFAERFTPFVILVILGVALFVIARYFVSKHDKQQITIR